MPDELQSIAIATKNEITRPVICGLVSYYIMSAIGRKPSETEISERDAEREAVAAPRIAGVGIIAPPGKRDRQAFVVECDAQSVAYRFKPVGAAQRIVALLGQIDDRRTEQRPVFRKGDAATRAHFLAVLQVFAQQQDVAVEPRIADHGIGRAAADRSVELVATDRQIVLVEPEAVRQAQEIAIGDRRAADDVRRPVGQPGAVGKQAGLVRQAIALA